MTLRRVRTQEDLKRLEQHYRQTGYDDGYAGKPCGSKQIDYAQAWKRGREQRERDQG